MTNQHSDVNVSVNTVRLSWGLLRESMGSKPSSNLKVQFIRSLVVSVIALVFDFGSLVFLKQIVGINYLVAATIGFSLGVVVNYVLSVWWVFADHKLESRSKEFTVFVVICIIGLVLNLVIIAGMVEALKLDYRLAKGVSTLVVFFWNFIARKKILY